jgi:site-specific DNA-methyltransferase (adenine-specific)
MKVYEDSAVTLYHGDARDIVPTLGRFDLVLTDPPYSHKHMDGGGFAAGSRFYAGGALDGMNDFDLQAYSDVLLKPSEMLIAFCSRDLIPDYAALSRDSKRKFDLHVWHKTNAIPFTANTWKSDLEYIALLWTKKPGWKQLSQEKHSKAFISPICQDKSHPACKPVTLLAKYIEVLDAQTILDPFAGSGTCGRAAKDLGRKCVLIEREEKYCEIIIKRLAQEVFAF